MPSVTGKIQIPLIHESSAVTGDGMLTKRQQAWVAGATNDVSIENRVLYKHKIQQITIKGKKTESSEDSMKVRGLPSDLSVYTVMLQRRAHAYKHLHLTYEEKNI